MSISVRVIEKESRSGQKGLTGNKIAESVIKKFSVSELKSQVRDLSSDLNELFSDLSNTGKFQLDTIDVGLEISSEGGVNLIGHATVGASASIQLSFKKTEK